MKSSSVIIYTDGACSGNPGPGGWGAVVCFGPDNIVEMGGGAVPTTNNRMETEAALHALEKVASVGTKSSIAIYTDSTYLIRGITQWVWAWKKKGWRTAEGQPVTNRDIWERLLEVVIQIGRSQISWNYVRGHQGTPGNERCDEIAVAFSQGRTPDLFRGSQAAYHFDVMTPPPPQALPEMKPKSGPAAKPLAYLSNIGGVIERHPDWASCERRVKGRSGAKFKKVMNEAEEQALLREWGKA